MAQKYLRFFEEAFDDIAIAVKERAVSRDALSVRCGFDAGPCAARSQSGAHGTTVVGAISKQDAAFAKGVEHVIGGSTVMGLPFGQLETDRQAEPIVQCMDLGRQATARATHATGSAVFFWALAACWWTRIEEESIIWMSR